MQRESPSARADFSTYVGMFEQEVGNSPYLSSEPRTKAGNLQLVTNRRLQEFLLRLRMELQLHQRFRRVRRFSKTSSPEIP